ncbi:MAG: TonB-dependent receptor [Thermodesulforhabdaceae bacterium]
MRKCWIFLAIVPLFVAFSCSFVFADQETSQVKSSGELEEIVVTESKIEQSPRDVTQKIDVITIDQIEMTPFIQRNIAEIFRYQPGTFVNPLSRNDANWGSYGGLGPKYSVYLLDGLPIDSFADLMSLDPIIIERAEVHRGPSTMYSNFLSMDFAGNQSPLSGITNLVLKEKISKPETRISAGYGSWNTITGQAYHQGAAGDFNYFFGGNYEKSDYTNYGTSNSWLHILDDPDYEKIKLYMKATYYIQGDEGHKVSLFAHHTQHNGDVGRPNRDYEHTYDTINLTYSNVINSSMDFALKGGFRRYDRSWDEDMYPNLELRSHDGVKQEIIPLDAVFHLKHGEGGLLSLGGDGQWGSYKTYSESKGIESKGNDMKAYSYGFYAQEKYVLGDWVFKAGGRYSNIEHNYDLLGGVKPEIDDKSWDRFLWNVGVRYNLSEMVSLYSNAGTSFMAPSGKSVGGTLKASDRGVPGKNGQLPNPDLKPEKGLGVDGGVDLKPMKGLSLGFRGFYNSIDDAIVENVVSRDPSQSQSVNAGTAKSYGIEAEARYFFTDFMEVFVNYTYINTTVENDMDPLQDDSNIPFVPDHSGNIGFVFYLPWDLKVAPYIHVFGKYYDSTDKSSRQKFGSQELINIHIEKGLVKASSWQMNLSLDFNNITNNKYEMPWQFKDPGFNTLARIEIKF